MSDITWQMVRECEDLDQLKEWYKQVAPAEKKEHDRYEELREKKKSLRDELESIEEEMRESRSDWRSYGEFLHPLMEEKIGRLTCKSLIEMMEIPE